MAFRIEQARDPVAVRRILEELPEWFGDPEAVDEYVADAAGSNFVSMIALESGITIGVSLVRRHFPQSAELHLIAISAAARGQGVGRALVERIARDPCRRWVCAAFGSYGGAALRKRGLRSNSVLLSGNGFLSLGRAQQPRLVRANPRAGPPTYTGRNA